MHQTVGVWCLGQVRVTVGGEEIALKADQRALVATLAAAGPAGLAHGSLHHLLYGWEDSGDNGPAKTRQRVYRLRKRLGDAAPFEIDVITKGDRYGFDLEHCFVDTWAFEASSLSTHVGELERALDLWQGQPFASIEEPHADLLHQANRLRRRLSEACEKLAHYLTLEVAPRHINLIVSAAADDLANEGLTSAAAGALYRVGRQPDALELLAACRRRLLNRHGLDSGTRVNEVEAAILNHDASVLAAKVEDFSPRPEVIAAEPVMSAPRRFLGRHPEMSTVSGFIDQVVDLPASGGATQNKQLLLVSGAAGMGKSALMQKLVEAARHSSIEVRLAAVQVGESDGDDDEAYGPILRSVPEVRHAFQRVEQQVDSQLQRLRYWDAIVDELAVLGRDRPVLVVLEDLHFADSQTSLLIRHLAWLTLPAGVKIALSARPPAPDDPQMWHETYEALTKSPSVTRIELAPLDSDALRELVRLDHPTEPPMRQTRFADRLEDLSGGNPLIATVLSRDAPRGLDPSQLPDTVTPEESFAEHLQAKVTDPELRELLSIAALIGQMFDPSLLAETLGIPLDTVQGMLRQAAELDICELTDAGMWRFDHLLTVNYFTSRLTLLRPLVFARLAQNAAADSGSAVRYIRGAGAELSTEFALPALLEAGDRLAERGAFSEAASAFGLALERLDSTDERRYGAAFRMANATSRSGALSEAKRWRDEAFSLAAGRDDHDAMCRAAMAGLPDGEFAGGEPDRLALLRRVDSERITFMSAAEFSRARLRQARLCEQYELVREIYDQRDERWEFEDPTGWHAMQFEWHMYQAGARTGPAIHDQLVALADDLGPGPLRAEVLHRLLIAALAEQRPDAATRVFERAKDEASLHGSPRTRWAIDVVGATLARVDMRTDGGSLEHARLSGLRWGIPDAFDNWAVQVWVDRWLDRDHAATLALIQGYRTAIAPNLAWAAGEALGCAHAGDQERAADLAEEVANVLAAGGDGNWDRIAAALLIEAAAAADLPVAARAGAESLKEQAGMAIILGHGSAHLGPVDRYLGIAASVTGDEDPEQYFANAQEQAERAGAGLWLARCQEQLTDA